MKFHHISLRVRDFERSMHFYQTLLGLSVAKAFQPDAESNVAEVIVAKNRHGSTATVKMGWIGRYTKFRTIVDESQLPQ